MNESFTIAVPTAQVTALIERRDPIIEQASILVVEDADGLDEAAIILASGLKPMMTAIHEALDPVVELANKAHKAAVKVRKDLLAPLEEADGIVRGKVAEYWIEEEQRQAEEQRRLDEEHRVKLRAEADAQAAKAAAESVSDSYDFEAANDAISDVEQYAPPAPIARPMPPKPKGVTITKRWTAEVTDFKALVRAIAAGTAPISILKIDSAKLSAMARSTDGQLNYPGVKVYEVVGTSVRG